MANFKVVGNVVGVPNPKPDVYTKPEIDKKLDKKVNKEDVVSAYRFCGSVETFDDLPIAYPLIPNGVPTHNDEPCGTYDEETHTVTINSIMLTESSFDKIKIPIMPIKVKAGKYHLESTYFGQAIIGQLNTWECTLNGYTQVSSDTVSYIEIFNHYGDGHLLIEGSTNYMGELPKIIDSWLWNEYSNDYHAYPTIPDGAYDNGAVYEVKDSGLSYGWTGSTWDALGTSHIDQVARDDIENLESQMGNVETALDGIIVIQNELIGGDSQ